ncbi:VOC family protein [Polycladidibacter stylochi]|uniref:VOC family protein n=1 Tax=Polycladidibacter stylochi TaxID=1807766 RepID=UPI00082E1201|nr:VOC family protein [Pseudovibrio stylochi]
MSKAIHMMVRVLEEERSLAFYETALGLKVADRFDFESFTLIYLRNEAADFEVELTVNKDRSAPYELGDGYGHIAFCVDDVAAERERMAAAGLAPEEVKEFFREGNLMARFFFITDPDGYRIEILERHGRYR